VPKHNKWRWILNTGGREDKKIKGHGRMWSGDKRLDGMIDGGRS
jgi:hypothetical protein